MFDYILTAAEQTSLDFNINCTQKSMYTAILVAI